MGIDSVIIVLIELNELKKGLASRCKNRLAFVEVSQPSVER